MATDWRDIIRRGSTPAPQADPVAPPQTSEMARLLAERSALEARMAALTGKDSNAARYPVTPLAQRRADHRRWEDGREEARRKTLAEPRPTPRAQPAPARTPAAHAPTPGGTPVDPRRWYARRDAPVTSPESRPRPPVNPPRATQKAVPLAAPKPAYRPRAAEPARPVKADPPPQPAPRRAKGELTPVRPVKPVKSVVTPRPLATRKPVDPLASRDAARATPHPRPTKSRDALPELRPRPAPKPDPAPREPARPFGSDLRRAVTDTLDRPIARKQIEKVGADRIAKPKEKIGKPLEKAREALDSANRATRTLSDAWDKRRDRIAGPDLTRYTQGYDARKARLLGVETGSLNDMAQRSERQREAGIARRAEARRSEAADENRRSRAQQNRLEQRKAERQ